MIEELDVRGIGGIRSARMIFSGDFIVITGESGSGKSSLVRAFEFVSGRRMQTAYVRSDCEEASVGAVWADIRDGERLITKRSISRGGRGRCAIHGEIATVSQLADVSSRLIEIQSQFSQLDLLDPARQLDLVDSCGGDELKETKGRLAELFPKTLSAEKEVLDLKKRRSSLEAELESAPAMVRRIKSLSLYPGCEKEWADELEAVDLKVSEAGKFEEIIYRISGGESGVNLLDQLGSLFQDLYCVAPGGSRARWEELGERALSSANELFESARTELGMTPREELEARRDALEAKMGILRKLKRETGSASAEDLASYVQTVEESMKWLKDSRSLLDEKQAHAAELRAEVGVCARKLRLYRECAASEFETRVNGHLAGLAMEGTRFSVEILRQDKVRASGAESAAFMLSANGGALNPVSKVASGGELSRILIAIQASMDRSRLPGLLVFDEVEAGLGGRAALLAGQKLREISRCCRIILITHEAAIAAMANQHFVVKRNGDETEVFEAEGETRAREIARMLAGSESAEAMKHARALLDI
jgi:DNA repair protein RecN (Recombination protein N)